MAAGVLLLLMIPAGASAQSTTVPVGGNDKVSLHVAAGPTIVDPGNSVSAGIGFTPTPRLTLSVTASRDHLNYRRERLSSFRGGTLATIAGEARVHLAPGKRVSPYVVGGMGWGVSRPNVEGPFDTRVTNAAQTLFAGGGLEIPLDRRLSVVADARFMFVAERDSLAAMVPVRVGVAWRF
jgi:hypothetical protein